MYKLINFVSETTGFVDTLFEKLQTGMQDDPDFKNVQIKEEPQEEDDDISEHIYIIKGVEKVWLTPQYLFGGSI